jgi:hypothetical protein
MAMVPRPRIIEGSGLHRLHINNRAKQTWWVSFTYPPKYRPSIFHRFPFATKTQAFEFTSHCSRSLGAGTNAVLY